MRLSFLGVLALLTARSLAGPVDPPNAALPNLADDASASASTAVKPQPAAMGAASASLPVTRGDSTSAPADAVREADTKKSVLPALPALKRPKAAPELVAVTHKLDSGTPRFIENRGQFDERVKFKVQGGGRTLWLTRDRIVFDVLRAKPGDPKVENQDSKLRAAGPKSVFPGLLRQPRIPNPGSLNASSSPKTSSTRTPSRTSPPRAASLESTTTSSATTPRSGSRT